MKMEKPEAEYIQISEVIVTAASGGGDPSSTDCYTSTSKMASCAAQATWMYDNLG